MFDKQTIDTNTEFYRKILTAKPQDDPEFFNGRLNLDKPFELSKFVLKDGCKILDVGAGPITLLGYKVEGKSIEITPIDILADVYNKLLDELKIVPPIRTIQCSGDNLSSMYDKNLFDIVHSGNALDHMENPIETIQQMIKVVKPGGVIYIWIFENVGENSRYEELHQWNITRVGSNMFLWGKIPNVYFDLTRIFQDQAEILLYKRSTRGNKPSRLDFIIRKNDD